MRKVCENAAGVSSIRDPISYVVGVEICTSMNFSYLSKRRRENHSVIHLKYRLNIKSQEKVQD
jgi:hypothetical protein